MVQITPTPLTVGNSPRTVGLFRFIGWRVDEGLLGAQSCAGGLRVILGAQEERIEGLMRCFLGQDYHLLAQAPEQEVLPE